MWVISDLYVRRGMAGTNVCVELGLCQPIKLPIFGHLLQSLAGVESPRTDDLGAGEPFFWRSDRTRSVEGPFGLHSGRTGRRPRDGNVRGSQQNRRGQCG